MPKLSKRRDVLDAGEAEAAGENGDAVRCFRLLIQISRRLRYLLDRRLKEDGLTTQQGSLLTAVRRQGRPSLGEVASMLSTTHQNAKQLALALERKGMLRIEADSLDGRMLRLSATAASDAHWQSRNAADFKAVGEWFSALSAKDREMLAALLSRLSASLP